MKKFLKKTEGFTLVELVVVIAILGVLAGVGTVGYSGYVKKANLAADQQLLAIVNQAFATACIENGVNPTDDVNAAMTLGDDGSISEDDDSLAVTHEKSSDIEEDFWKYFDGTSTAAFKVFENLTYNQSAGKFEGSDSRGYTYTDANGITYKADEADVVAYLASTLGQNLDADELLNLIDSSATKVADVYGEAYLNAIVAGPGFKTAASRLLGEDYDAYMTRQKEAAAKAYAEANGLDWEDDWDREDAMAAVSTEVEAKVEKNMTALVTADSAQTAGDTIMAVLQAGGAKEAIKTKVNDPSSTMGLSQAALAYGMYISYLEFSNQSTNIQPGEALNGLDDADFQDYLTKDQAQKDLKGLLAAMNVVNTQNADAINSVVTNGLANNELKEAFDSIMK